MPGRAGRTAPSPPSAWATSCAACAPLRQVRLRRPLYGHFGQGLVHTRITFDLRTPGGVEQFRDFTRQAADLVVRMGGSLSGEHGDGQSRAEWLERMYGPELIQAFRDFKAIWDPLNRMNPHKVVEPYRVDDNLRMGPTHNPRHPETHFKFPHDKGSFAYALERCVGVGKCRKTESGTMCPSYMATREEMHSTRGRTHLLFELMNADVIGRDGGWRDESVREALSLCLACKGCKAECPVNVDMATYKAEFLTHYYEGRLRPMPAYAMGLIYWWARAASLAPGLVNYFTQNDPWARWLKKLGGIAPERQMPSFAQETARAWFRKRGGPRGNGKRILFWPDTFNNYLKSDTAKAAIEVLERLGYRVELPPRTLCCGRPLYDWGMLSTARRLLVQVMDSLEAEIRDGTPIVGIEPSCVATFRDELPNLFPDDERAQKLSKQVVLLGEFLMHEKVELPRLGGKALVHIHCHHKSVLQHTTEAEVLKRLGLDFTSLDSGCCGMAGAFGFEAANYGVSVAVAERRLLPALREAEPGALLIANGFSCREQIQDLAGQETLHLADVIKKALDARK
jgi:Fe-S oxidoreductase